MKILIIDAQGGGIGKQLVTAFSKKNRYNYINFALAFLFCLNYNI